VKLLLPNLIAPRLHPWPEFRILPGPKIYMISINNTINYAHCSLARRFEQGQGHLRVSLHGDRRPELGGYER
jgi:hypothetical protein